MRRWYLLLAFSFLSTSAARAEDVSQLARQVATSAGLEAFGQLERIAFTWIHHPSGTERSYDWDLRARTVTVTTPEGSTVVPSDGYPREELRGAHSAFINDSYWALFELHLVWDEGVRFESLGEQEVPGFADLGRCRALAVDYASEGGYTPGDRYVLYLGDDGLPLAWAYHRGGSEEPTLVTRRTAWQDVNGVQVPTMFTKSDGSAFISIEGLRAE